MLFMHAKNEMEDCDVVNGSTQNLFMKDLFLAWEQIINQPWITVEIA